MPERIVCDQAIQLASTRLKVSDPDLVQGQVEMFKIAAGKWEMPRPWGREGGFAVVYKFRTRSGKLRALRCFRVPMKHDIQDRYEQIGPYFSQHIPSITVECRFYAQGIVIGEGQERRPYPLIDMEWVEGITLLEKVERLCEQRDRNGLADLVRQWEQLVRLMRQARIAHGDLAGENVMVRADGRLVLVDYDGVYIPGFEGRSGLIKGQDDYQHPEMDRRRFDEKMDAFSSLAIYTALLALQAQPELWRLSFDPASITIQSNGRPKRDGGLLFARRDFLDPGSSPLFQELLRMNEDRVRQAAEELQKACRQSIEQVQFPLSLLDPDHEKKEALAKLRQAIQSSDDSSIVRAWNGPLLDTYAPAQIHLQRVEQARHTLQVLQRYRKALLTRDMPQILAAYDPLLEHIPALSEAELRCLTLTRRFAQALHLNEDSLFLQSWEELQQLPPTLRPRLDTAEQERVGQALQRKAALQHFQDVLAQQGARGQAEQILSAYHPMLNDCPEITPQQRALIEAAQRFQEIRAAIIPALRANEYEKALQYYDEPLLQQFCLTEAEEALLEQLHVRMRLEQAIQAKDHGQALRLARRIEVLSRSPLKDYRLAYERRKFIRQFDITSLEAHLQGETVTARWRWPDDKLIRYAVMVWRTDRWPRHPQLAEQGSGLLWITRNGNEQVGNKTFYVGSQQQIYLQSYLAMSDEIRHPPEWFYSSGHEPGSRLLISRAMRNAR